MARRPDYLLLKLSVTTVYRGSACQSLVSSSKAETWKTKRAFEPNRTNRVSQIWTTTDGTSNTVTTAADRIRYESQFQPVEAADETAQPVVFQEWLSQCAEQDWSTPDSQLLDLYVWVFGLSYSEWGCSHRNYCLNVLPKEQTDSRIRESRPERVSVHRGQEDSHGWILAITKLSRKQKANLANGLPNCKVGLGSGHLHRVNTIYNEQWRRVFKVWLEAFQ